MAKRRKRSSRRRAAKDPVAELFGLLVPLGMVAAYGFQTYLKPFYDKNKEHILIGIVIFAVFVVGIFGIWIWRKFITKKRRREGADPIFNSIVQEVELFKPVRGHSSEALYQMELAGFLKKTFSSLNVEETRSNVRPDIVIGNIAIEVKWPTGKKELRTIADKIIRYLKQYDQLVVVLFDLQMSEAEYSEWEDGIFETFSNRADSLVIITV